VYLHLHCMVQAGLNIGQLKKANTQYNTITISPTSISLPPPVHARRAQR